MRKPQTAIASIALLCLPLLGYAAVRPVMNASMTAPTAYVVTRTDATGSTLPGFVVVSMNEQMPAVLGYSSDGVFPDGNLPEHIAAWMDSYETMADTRSVVAQQQNAAAPVAADIAPLLGGRLWGQGEPYNILCPEIEGQRCVTGCVATALAQVMCTLRWPAQYDWDDMRDTYGPLLLNDVGGESILNNQRYRLQEMSLDEPHSQERCTVEINTLTSTSTSSFTGIFALLLTDEEGNFIQRASEPVTLKNAKASEMLNAMLMEPAIPPSLPDGKYRIYAGLQSEGSAMWMLCGKRNNMQEKLFLTIEKIGNTFMLADRFFPCSVTVEEAEPVARLMADVGAAIEMDYGTGSSGATPQVAAKGLRNKMGYDSDLYVATPDAYSDEQWHRLLQQELQAGRPVCYLGGGHAYVIDGMQTADDGTPYYHVNWGWNGLCNGYYLLNMLRPTEAGTGGTKGTNYSNGATMLIGMVPEDGKSELRMACKDLELRTGEVYAGQVFSACLHRLALLSGNDYEGSFQLVMYGIDGEQGDTIVVYDEPQRAITASRGLTNYYMRCTVPDNLPAGNYRVAVRCRRDDGTQAIISIDQWPVLTVNDETLWPAADKMTPVQLLASRGAKMVPGETVEQVALYADSLINVVNSYASGELALLVCDTDTKLAYVMDNRQTLSLSGNAIKKYMTIRGRFSKYLPDGDYLLALGFKHPDSTRWTLVNSMEMENSIFWCKLAPLYYPMQVTDGVALIGGISYEGAEIPLSIGRIELSPQSTHTAYDLLGRKAAGNTNSQFIIINRKKVWKKEK